LFNKWEKNIYNKDNNENLYLCDLRSKGLNINENGNEIFEIRLEMSGILQKVCEANIVQFSSYFWENGMAITTGYF
jgi:hypothetical protein